VIDLLREDNTRTGFFEERDSRAVLSHLPEDLQPVAEAAYVTGWRVKSELLTQQWAHIDFKAGWLRLEPGEAKSGDGRMFPLSPMLRAVLDRQRERTEAVAKETGRIVPWVFHRGGPSSPSAGRGPRPASRLASPRSSASSPARSSRAGSRTTSGARLCGTSSGRASPAPPPWPWSATSRRASTGATPSWTKPCSGQAAPNSNACTAPSPPRASWSRCARRIRAE
jgi:hypothetical protein